MSRLPAHLRVPAPSRLDPSHPRYAQILAAHERALEAGADGYIDPETGLWVFTARYLWERGYCCHTGCRHCPYLER